MENCVGNILSECGVTSARATPAAETLFEVRQDVQKVSPAETAYFHTYVAKILYLAKSALQLYPFSQLGCINVTSTT